MAEIHRLRRTGSYDGKTIPSATRTVIYGCDGETDMIGPHIHLFGFARERDQFPEYEMVIGEDIARHIIEILREQGCKI